MQPSQLQHSNLLKGTSINCLCLWLYTRLRIKARFWSHAQCISKKCNAESELGVKPRRARPEACICRVVNLENGITILLRLTPCSYMLQVAQRT